MTLFQKIIDKEIPAKIIYEDDLSLVFEDINPQAPTHLLIIPKKPIVKISDVLEEDKELMGHLIWVAGEVARKIGVEDAFRLVVNNGAKAGQSVFHVHVHLLSGRPFLWPPG
jgi:histidine triad (HIT) family protein